MHPRLAFPLSVLLLLASVIQAEEKPAAPRVAAIDEAVQRFIDSGEIAGAVTLVADGNAILHHSAVGLANIAEKSPIQRDSVFWIASMSKPVTGVCVMKLIDQGKLSLDDPITKHLPEMQGLKTADGKPAHITIRHLLSHTSGMAELPRGEAYMSRNLAEAAERYSQVDILFPPGSEWRYSQTSINTAARIVEVVSGRSFDQFVDEEICQPLGMTDTGFYLSDSTLDRLATSYRKTENGLEPTEVMILAGHAPTYRDRMPAANGGLFSTAADYAKFCQMLLNEGRANGHQILSPDAVRTMRTITTGDLKTGFTPGNGWGIGCCVIREPQGVSATLSPGTFGHGGAYGTQAWIDPVKQRVHILMVQRANFPNSDASELRQAFHEATDQALQE